MRCLLDTHALLWWLGDDERLGLGARAVVADPSNEILVSVVSLWEIVVKVRIGKLRADIREIEAAIERDGFTRVAVEQAHLAALSGLPRHADHRDPFDHLLIAQAIADSAAFLSDDRNAVRYPVERIACSDAVPSGAR